MPQVEILHGVIFPVAIIFQMPNLLQVTWVYKTLSHLLCHGTFTTTQWVGMLARVSQVKKWRPRQEKCLDQSQAVRKEPRHAPTCADYSLLYPQIHFLPSLALFFYALPYPGSCSSFLWLLWPAIANLVAIVSKNVFSYSSGGQRSEMDLT